MLVTLLFIIFLIFICVVIHYEALYRFPTICAWFNINGRLRVVAGSLWALIAHTIEVWCFGVGYYLLLKLNSENLILDPFNNSYDSFSDMLYFSFVNYTSLGYGDLVPSGPIRFIAGVEALVGLVFIAWTASFLYLKMEHNWKQSA